MAPKFIAFIMFVWITAAILGLVMEQQAIGADQVSTLQQLTGMQLTGGSGGLTQIAATPLNYLGALWKAITLQTVDTFLTGGWVYVKWIVLAPIIAMGIWGLVLSFLQIFSKIIPTP